MPGNLPMAFQFVYQTGAQINYKLTIDWYALFISSPAGVRHLGNQQGRTMVAGGWFRVPDTNLGHTDLYRKESKEMGRLKAMNAQNRKVEQQQEQATFWPELCRRVDAGQVIPIISATAFYEQIFDMDGDGLLGISEEGETHNGLSLEEQLADAWADGIGYPLNGSHRIAQVALYNRVVKSRDDLSAKSSYLNWLKQALLFLAADDPAIDLDTIEEQQQEIEQSSFADIAIELGYPRPPKGSQTR
jgi:hypothetical protein